MVSSCVCPVDELEMVVTALPFPLIFVCPTCQKPYVCKGFEEKCLLPFDIKRQAGGHKYEQATIREGICHLHKDPLPSIPLEVVKGTYAELFLHRMGAYTESVENITDAEHK